ncbi:hypothetical protein M407DRAFT_244796 [Tulasnella calospora MUT 4182]|uniref:Protein FRG1 n=1 Tax=Tulasnella calospora MUT 4182 TaxID=1051891 RepID=A0A0C3QEF4_9AGAM|nr:hypothetical protein M407DRAFT_244796 [Tulasnella calospora MUT 4182]
MSDSTAKVRSTKLTFKGDKKGKKRKRKDKDVGGHDSGGEGSDAEGGDPQAWVYPSNPLQVLGPTFIIHPTSPQSPTCITYEQTRARIVLHTLSAEEDGGGIGSIVPTEVNQVWVVTRIAGSATINLRTPDGKFMSCDQHGVVSSDREARGPQEEWTPVILPDAPGMVAFQNYYSKYMSIDETAGGTMSLRGDSEEVGFKERFFVKVQADKKFQAWGAGRSVVSEGDRKELKKARKDGNLSEALLDRRAKLKSNAIGKRDAYERQGIGTKAIERTSMRTIGGMMDILALLGRAYGFSVTQGLIACLVHRFASRARFSGSSA